MCRGFSASPETTEMSSRRGAPALPGHPVSSRSMRASSRSLAAQPALATAPQPVDTSAPAQQPQTLARAPAASFQTLHPTAHHPASSHEPTRAARMGSHGATAVREPSATRTSSHSVSRNPGQRSADSTTVATRNHWRRRRATLEADISLVAEMDDEEEDGPRGRSHHHAPPVPAATLTADEERQLQIAQATLGKDLTSFLLTLYLH